MNLWSSVSGMVVMELTSAEPEIALDMINRRNISVYRVEYISDLTVRFQIARSDYKKLCSLMQKRGETLGLRRKIGLYWTLRNLLRRKLLILGIVFLLFLVFFLPGRILFVSVEGNQRLPTRQILAAAEECGIRFFANRREVRSEKVKNALLYALPELQWVGVNTKGCVAVLSVRERTEQPRNSREGTVCSIVAVRDGVVDTCVATRGNLVCTAGQAVKAGQVLISGYTDCGLYLQATRAEGEIYALTRRELEVITPLECISVEPTGHVKRRVSLLLGKNRINLWKDSGIWDATCDRIYMEYYVTLPGGFRLPMAFAVDTYYFREETACEDFCGETALADYAHQYLVDQMIAGEIRTGSHLLLQADGCAHFTGRYVCREMIGREQQEKIGENYVQNN